MVESVAYKVQEISGRSRFLRMAAMALILGIALFLRVYRLEAPLMWCDEAESSINALTILSRGVPVDTYLGLPIYENTLTDPWPESTEYEFRDSSYSRKGVAIYHAWLPLYSIAGSMKLFGVQPDMDSSALKPAHDRAGMNRRTIAGRAPSVLAGMLLLVLIYCGACEMYGCDAGWGALIAAAISDPMLGIARQARYYSLTTCLATACCLIGWRMYKYGRWRDFILGAILFSLLFHTHILTFASACLACCTLLPFMFRHPQAVRKILAFVSIVIAATVPWLVATGFLGAANSIPLAIKTMNLPHDLIVWPLRYWQLSLLLIMGMILTLLLLRADRLPLKLREAYADHRMVLYFLAVWIITSYAVFMCLIPAASLFFQRTYLGALGPGIIFGSIIFAGLGRMVSSRVGVPLATATFVIFVYSNTYAVEYPWRQHFYYRLRMVNLITEMRDWSLKPGTRIYSNPNDHLTLMFYSGMPVQSIAPVRKSFLDRYPGDIIMLDSWVHLWPVSGEDVARFAQRFGVNLTPKETLAWAEKINRVSFARKIKPAVTSVVPLELLPPFAESLIIWQKEETGRWWRTPEFDFKHLNPSIFSGFSLEDPAEWWQIYSYRFVSPIERIREHANYADRLRRGHASVLPSLCTVYRSPGDVPADREKSEE